MSLVQISKKPLPTSSFALFNLGFRPFFLGAAVFAIVSIGLWVPVFLSYIALPMGTLSPFQWHSHEMIYGYAMAVIAGFLLTAVMNWTGIKTTHGRSLIQLFLLWLAARMLFLFGVQFLELAALSDMLFMFGLLGSVATPIIRVKQWQQLGILATVVLLTLGNLSFYLGAFGLLRDGSHFGIYVGLYTVIALIVIISGRVFPAFIRNGVAHNVAVSNPRWITNATLALFIVFFVNQLFIKNQAAQGFLSISLFTLNTIRLISWYSSGIWSKPLLWSLYLSVVFINIGFLLSAISVYAAISPYLAVHAFAIGGIGVVTLGMMARVSLGHTGRDIRSPPSLITFAFLLLVLGGIFRVGFPLVSMAYYTHWIVLAQVSWITAFALFLISFTEVLYLPRADGQLE